MSTMEGTSRCYNATLLNAKKLTMRPFMPLSSRNESLNTWNST